jgi:hypothetical protein
MAGKKTIEKDHNMWRKLDWATKVKLCEQGRANENSLLHNYYVIFIAVETILFAAVFSIGYPRLWGGFIGLLGLFLAILWAHVCELRGNAVDRWEEILASLWREIESSELGVSELADHYKGAVERRRKRRDGGRRAIFFWGWGGIRRFLSARWVFTSFIPFLVVCVWVWVIVECFTS